MIKGKKIAKKYLDVIEERRYKRIVKWSKRKRKNKKRIVLKGRKIIRRVRKRFKISNLLIIINLLFILGCCIFYGTRLINFYRIEHPHIDKDSNILDVISIKNTVTTGDGLYEDDDEYYYKGKNVNNYVIYSGRLWRIISIDKESNIKMITEDSQTSLVWGINTDYEKSYVRSWLNDENMVFKSFFASLDDPNSIGYTRTCIDVIEDKITCEKTVNDRVGLLSYFEYKKAGAEKSYLNTGRYWWLSNVDKNNTSLYVFSKGNVNNDSFSGTSYYSYGVRPVITISGFMSVKSGNGKKESPVNLDSSKGNTLKDKYVGEYIKFGDYNWRIIDKGEEYVKVVMDGVISVEGEKYESSFGGSNYCNKSNKVCSYINKDFYESIKKDDYILEREYYTGYYDKTYNYELNHLKDRKEKLFVGLLHLGELFVNDYNNYFLLSRTIDSDNNIYEVLDNDQIYAGNPSDKSNVRVTMYLKPDIILEEGLGTRDKPYIIK